MLCEYLFQRLKSWRGFEECTYHKSTNMMFCVRVVKKALKMWSCIKGALNIAFKEIPYHLKKDFFDHVLNYSYQYLALFYRKGQRSREEQHDFV